MKDDLIVFLNGRRPYFLNGRGPHFLFVIGIFVCQWKITLIYFVNRRKSHIFWPMEEALKCLGNEDNFHISVHRR